MCRLGRGWSDLNSVMLQRTRVLGRYFLFLCVFLATGTNEASRKSLASAGILVEFKNADHAHTLATA
jgi:hypothetical protein